MCSNKLAYTKTPIYGMGDQDIQQQPVCAFCQLFWLAAKFSVTAVMIARSTFRSTPTPEEALIHNAQAAEIVHGDFQS